MFVLAFIAALFFGLGLMVWGVIRMTDGPAENGRGNFLFCTGLALVLALSYLFG
jgi:hypothetical protein